MARKRGKAMPARGAIGIALSLSAAFLACGAYREWTRTDADRERERAGKERDRARADAMSCKRDSLFRRAVRR